MTLPHVPLQLLGGNCYETGTCDFTQDAFNVMLMPLQWNLGDFTPAVLWGIIIGIIWLRTHSVQLVGVVGIALNSLLVTFYAPAREVGLLLLGLSVGIVVYQLITNRLHHGSST